MGEGNGSDEERVIRVRGLPWSATKDDVIKFFGKFFCFYSTKPFSQIGVCVRASMTKKGRKRRSCTQCCGRIVGPCPPPHAAQKLGDAFTVQWLLSGLATLQYTPGQCLDIPIFLYTFLVPWGSLCSLLIAAL